MSYRSVKRVLGETRLELKCLVLFAICLLTLIGGSFWWYGSKTEVLVYSNTRSTCAQLVKAVLIQQHWKRIKELEMKLPYANSTGATVDPALKNEFELIDILSKELLSKNLDSFGESQRASSASEIASQSYDVKLLKPAGSDFEAQEGSPPQVLSAKEQDVLSYFEGIRPSELTNADDTRDFIDEPQPDQQEYHYYQPIRARSTCLTCHRTFSRSTLLSSAGLSSPPPVQEGDLMAVAKVVIPDGSTQKALNENRAIFLAAAVVTVFLAMIASYVIVRYVIVKPLKHLRDVSEEISHGNLEARADIQTADEFEELGNAFNKMVRHLVTIQDELKHTNTALDVKVDELAQTNMRLYEMNRLKSDFLATMSHELRTPLNSIIGFSEVLDSIKSLDDKQRRYVQNIQKSGRVLLDMINDILDLAKIESGKMELKLGDFRVENVVQAQCDFFKPQTERKNIDLEVDVEPGLPEMFQDQAKVQQVLSNLLSNAIKFTPEGGRIEVRTKRDRERDELVLTVTDTGVGIAEEDQVTIFEKFRQGQAVMAQGDAITREYSGTGLGLSIVKELCKLLGGEVTVESQLGRGSTFTIRLPWTRAGHAKLDGSMKDNFEEMLRPRRQEVQRTLERAGAPGAEV
jgi:two-component system, NarL family, sensor histidine kinase BarA